MRLLGPPGTREPAAPHRFAKILGATGTTAATAFLIAGFTTVGFAIAAIVGLLAALAALTGLCVGCKMYRQVSFLHHHDIV